MNVGETVDNTHVVKSAIYAAAQTLRGYVKNLDAQLALFEQVRSGALDNDRARWTPVVAESIEMVMDALRIAYNYPHKNFPDEFWTTAEGELVADIYEWLYGHEYLRLSEAGMILYDLEDASEYSSTNKIRVAMNHHLYPEGHNKPPKLRLYWKRDDLQKKRVRKSEVIAIKPSIRSLADRVANKLQRQRLALQLSESTPRKTEREIARICGVSLTQTQRDIAAAKAERDALLDTENNE